MHGGKNIWKRVILLNSKRVILLTGFLLWVFLIPGKSLFAQQDVNDRDINKIKIKATDTVVKSMLPHKLQPASEGRPVNYADSLNKAKKSIAKTIVSINEGNMGMALFNIYEALNFTPRKELRTYALANSYYSIIQIKLGNHAKAVNSINKSDSIFRQIGDINLLAFHYNNMGLFNQRFNNQNAAKKFFMKSLEISRNFKDHSNIAFTLNLLSKNDGDPIINKEYLDEAILINKMLRDSVPLAENYNNLARIYFKLNNFSQSKYYLDLSNQIAKKKRAAEIISDNYALYSKLYAAQNRHKEAYDALLNAASAKESLQGSFNAVDIEQIIENREIAKKNFELSLKDNKLRIKQLTLSLTILGSFLILLVVVSFYLYFYLNSRRRLLSLENRQKLMEKEKQFAEYELVNIATYLNSRNEILKNIQQDLSRIYKLPDSQVSYEVRKVNTYIRSLLTKNDEVEDIIQRTEKINKDFLEKLVSLHPEITKNEKNIALMLRAGLSTKQIATLLDCNIKSVNMARYRMRIHLNLENDQNLVTYLKSL